MSSPRKVYALSSGSYSDYQVHVLFTSEALAKEAMQVSHGLWGPFIEEFTMHDEIPEPVASYKMSGVVRFDGGEQKEPEFETWLSYPWTLLDSFQRRPRVVVGKLFGIQKKHAVSLTVSGGDEQAVKQAFSDRRAQLIAEANGV